MDMNVAGLMVIGLSVIVLSLMSQVSISSSTDTSLTSIQAVDRKGDRARTDLSIESATGGVTDLTVTVKNTGITSVYNFPQMDFIVEYTLATGNQVFARLTYTTGPLGDNQWKKTSITPDDFQPGAWNPGETITMEAKLSPKQKANTTGTVAVATPNGVALPANFSN